MILKCISVSGRQYHELLLNKLLASSCDVEAYFKCFCRPANVLLYGRVLTSVSACKEYEISAEMCCRSELKVFLPTFNYESLLIELLIVLL